MIHLIRYKMSHKKLFYFHWKNRSIFLMKHKSQESMKNMIWTWRMFHKSQEHGQSIWAHSERIRLRELLQESRTFNGKIYGFPLRFSLNQCIDILENQSPHGQPFHFQEAYWEAEKLDWAATRLASKEGTVASDQSAVTIPSQPQKNCLPQSGDCPSKQRKNE